MSGPLRLNLGCGTNASAGWVNIDRSPGLVLGRLPRGLRDSLARAGLLPQTQAAVEWPRNVRRLDVTKGIPYERSSVEAIYSSHMLEHLTRADAVSVLAACRRVLRPDGVLRLALPDLRGMARSYLESDDPSAADGFVDATSLGWRETPPRHSRPLELISGARHKWMYDAASIQAVCRMVGFAATQEWTFRAGRCPDLGSVEHREGSLFVEAYVTAPL